MATSVESGVTSAPVSSGNGTAGVNATASVSAPAATATTANGHVGESTPDIAEVGWLFVQQYYTYLSEQPRRLHLFYTLDSTLTHGVEGENNEACHGQPQIAQKIKEHGFEECKVLLSSVDCQPSANGGAVIQVLGEMANKGGREISQKFVQTFFLAPQVPRGYFVLNDIFRFLKEDVSNDFEESNGEVNGEVESSLFSQSIEEDEGNEVPVVAEAVAPVSPVAPVAATTTAPVPTTTTATATVEEEKENNIEVPTTEGEESVASAIEIEETPIEKEVSEPVTLEEPVNDSTTTTATTTEPTSTSTAPVSWAALAAKTKKDAANGTIEPAVPIATPIVANPPATIPANTTTTTAATSSSLPTTTPTANPTTNTSTPAVPPTAPTSTFQKPTFKQRPQVEYHSAYIKHVSHRVDDNLLKKALENIGQMTHFQVEKAKNCAFVDFVDAATLKAALAVHELQVGDQTVLIEERKRGAAKKNTFQRKNNQNNYNNNNNNNGYKKPFQKV